MIVPPIIIPIKGCIGIRGDIPQLGLTSVSNMTIVAGSASKVMTARDIRRKIE